MPAVRHALLLLVACLLAFGLAGCGSAADKADDGKVKVIAAFYPLQWIAERVGGDAVSVTSLTPEGSEPHDVSLDAKRFEEMVVADTVLYFGSDFQPEVEMAVRTLPSSVARHDLLSAPGVDLQAKDPHVWLDPVRMKAMAEATANVLKAAAPEHTREFDGGLQSINASLDGLTSYMAGKLTACAHPTVITSHAAFGYLTSRFGLQQLPIAGISPEAEPDPKTLKDIADAAKSRGVSTIFVEEALPPALAETVAREVGAKTEVLTTLEFQPGDGDYVSIQRQNADRLAAGLQCA